MKLDVDGKLAEAQKRCKILSEQLTTCEDIDGISINFEKQMIIMQSRLETLGTLVDFEKELDAADMMPEVDGPEEQSDRMN